MMVVLAGDIGGTHTRLALFDPGSHDPQGLETYPSADHGGLEEIVSTFLAAAQDADVVAAAFGVAGPVVDCRTETVNLAWPVDEGRMATALGLERARVSLLNDLEANAWGIPALGPDDLAVLNQGAAEAAGNIAVISAGTGLGQAGMFWDGSTHHVFATEGGHADFAPADDLQAELLAFLRAEEGHVSYERVCSGMGLVNIERFLRARAGVPEPDWVTDAQRGGGDVAAAIGRAAQENLDEISEEALDLLVDVYGAQAGNLALALMSTGGVYVGGGIAPRILKRMQDGRFLRAFLAKGRFTHLLERVPVSVILNDLTALLGAARRASQDV